MGASGGLYGDKYPWLMHTIYADSARVNVQAVCGQAGAVLGLLEPKLRGLMDAIWGLVEAVWPLGLVAWTLYRDHGD